MREVLVVGGGPAGTAAAIGLARAGADVRLLERSAGPTDKVCGDFLSGEALGLLQALGVDLDLLGAVPLRQVRLIHGKPVASAALPFEARSLSRCGLDDALLMRARGAGVEVVRGASAESIRAEAHGWAVDGSDGRLYTARNLIVATGKHDLRGAPRPPGKQPGLVAFKMYYRLAPRQAQALEGAVELILLRGGYAGLQPVEGGRANLCLVVRSDELPRVGGWSGLVTREMARSPHLAARLADAEPLLPRPLALSSIPYGFVREGTEPNLWWLGDQAAVIPSFSGDGVSIALHSGMLAAARLAGGAGSAAFQGELQGQVRRQVALATGVSRLLVGAPWLAHAAHVFPLLLSAVARKTRLPAAAATPLESEGVSTPRIQRA